MRVLREAVLACKDWPLLYNKLDISNTYLQAKNRNDLRPITLSKVSLSEVGFSTVAILGGGWLQSPASDCPTCDGLLPWPERTVSISNIMYNLHVSQSFGTKSIVLRRVRSLWNLSAVPPGLLLRGLSDFELINLISNRTACDMMICFMGHWHLTYTDFVIKYDAHG